MNNEIYYTTGYILIIIFAIIMLITIPISEFLLRKLNENKKRKD